MTVNCQIISVLADSVLVMPRTATVTVPYITALPSANKAPSVNELRPGLATMTHRRSRSGSAAQRENEARSFSHRIDTRAETAEPKS